MKNRFLIITLFILAIIFFSCQKSEDYYDGLYIIGADKTTPSVALTLAEVPESMGVNIASSAKVNNDIVAEMKASPEKVEEFNKNFSKDYILLPENCYILENTALNISKGNYASDRPLKVSIVSREGLEEGKTYLLPISIGAIKEGGQKIIEGSRTLYIVINQVVIAPAADLNSASYLLVDFAKESKYNTKALPAVTYEARILVKRFNTSKRLNTVMGLEENFLLRFLDNYLQVSGGFNTKGTIAIPSEQWVHVACVYDGTNTSIYVNGELDVTMPTARGTVDMTNVYGNPSFTIGTSANDGRYLYGYMSEVRVWAKARTASELKNNMCYIDPTTDGLLAYWRFNNLSENQTVTDLTGNGYEATYKGSGNLKYVEDVHCPE